MADAIVSFLDGGKRLRPAFAYWGWRGAGGDPGSDPAREQAVLRAAAALELVQMSALVHDDVMDGSASRRGQPSVHVRFSALHREQRWSGDAAGFGRAAAILIGDLGLIWADAMFGGSGLPADVVARAAPAYDLMRTEVMAGQYLDVLGQVRDDHDDPAQALADALRVARYKAAGYTVERPLHLGSLMAGDDPALRATYTEYGVAIGTAFQLRDDLLGVFGDPVQTGKPAGDDLREGKRTVLIALARAAATAEQRAVLEKSLGDPHLSQDDVAVLRTLLTETGAVARVETMISERTAEALRALDGGSVAPDAERMLRSLAVAATTRTY